MRNPLVARRMTTRVLGGFLIIAMIILVACTGPWYRIGFQGLLTDSGGNALTGSHNFVFDYWNCADGSGSGCSNVFSYTANGVQVTDGLFDVPIGPTASVAGVDGAPDPAIFAQPLWVEISVDGQTLTPRQPLVGSPYAMGLAGGAVISSPHEGDGPGGDDDTTINYASLTIASYGTTGTALMIISGANGDLIRACSGSVLDSRTCTNLKFRVTSTGDVRADGNYISGGADFAELIDFSDRGQAHEPGDVLVISSSIDRAVELATEPYSPSVIGVYSTNPGFLGGGYLIDDSGYTDLLPLAIIGIVPVKVSAENGTINRGDLLTTSSTPGHAMLADEYVPGTILGKAMGRLGYGTGVIDVFLILQ